MDGANGGGGDRGVGYVGGVATWWGRSPARYARLEPCCRGAPRPNRLPVYRHP